MNLWVSWTARDRNRNNRETANIFLLCILCLPIQFHFQLVSFLTIFCVQILYFDDKNSRLTASEAKIYLRDNFKTWFVPIIHRKMLKGAADEHHTFFNSLTLLSKRKQILGNNSIPPGDRPSIQKGRGCTSEILKRFPKRHQKPLFVDATWNFFNPLEVPTLKQNISPDILFFPRLNIYPKRYRKSSRCTTNIPVHFVWEFRSPPGKIYRILKLRLLLS